MPPSLFPLLLLLLPLHCAASSLNSSTRVQLVSSLGPALPSSYSHSSASSSTSASYSLLRVGAPATFSARDQPGFVQAQQLHNGWQLFAQWLNEERGGLLIRHEYEYPEAFLLQLAVVEDYSREDYAAAAARLLAANFSADFFFGPGSAPLTSAALAVTEPEDILMLSASSLHDRVCNESSLLLQLQPSTDTYTWALFEALNNLGAKSVSVVVDDLADSHCRNASEMEVLAAQFNITLLGFEAVNQDDYSNSLSGILLNAQASGVDVVAACPLKDVASDPELQTNGVCVQLPLAARNLSYSPSGLIFMHCDFDNPKTVAELGSTASYLLTVAPWHPSSHIVDSLASSGWTAEEFYSNYLSQFKITPTYHAAAAFASGTLLQVALEELTSIQAGNFRSGAQLAKVFKVPGSFYSTVFGNISFNTCGESMMSLLVLQKPDYLDKTGVVYPAQYSSISLVYPAPGWLTRNCEEDTQHCGGHGICSEVGLCECDSNYYGRDNPLSCDSYCTGEIVDDYCIEARKFYIGGTYAAQFLEHEEHIAHMRHAVELINNKTDGWFDDEMAQVQLVLEVEDSGCDAVVAEDALATLEDWAITESGGTDTMTAMLGAFCSSASMSIATQANIANFFQISYASTNEALSNVNQYRYFTRTAPSDAIQGPLLAKSLILLGITPYIAVVHLVDSYSSSLAKQIILKYEETDQYTVLMTYSFDSAGKTDADYDDIVFRIGESGCAAIVFVGYQDIALKIFQAAAKHPVLSTPQVLWLGIDAWTGLLLHDTVPLGVIGITPKVAHTPVTTDYIARWTALPPDEFPSLNGDDREILATYSATLVDATIALGFALQRAIDKHLDVTGAALFNEITSSVEFEGVSGNVQFEASGDLENPAFSLSNYQTRQSDGSEGESVGEWVVVGNVTETSFYVAEGAVQWPGDAVDASSFNKQLIPWCSAGSEPVLTFVTGVYSCSPCKVGFFKSIDGRSDCLPCPDGAMCDDTGIAVPCIESGYWREPAAATIDISDFSTFKIFRCEVYDVCRGGCELNNSCAPSRQRTSPVCGTCALDMYMADNKCHSCSADNMDQKTFRILMYVFVALGLVVFLSMILFVNLLATPTTAKKTKREEDVFISEKLINDMQGSKIVWRESSTSFDDNEDENEGVEMANRAQNSDAGDKGGDVDRSQDHVITSTKSIDTLKHSNKFKSILQRNKNGVKKFIRGASITGKITISFLQVITGSFLTLNLQYPHYMHQFYVDLQINPFQPIESTLKCADQANFSGDEDGRTVDGDIFFVSILLSVLCPIFFLVTLLLAILISRISYFFFIYPKKRSMIENKKQFLSRQFSKMYNLSIKLYIWFCLIMYPVLSANILGVFNCRDLGFSGIFLRGDYSISCESDSYRATRVLAIIGIVFIPIGVPLFFAALIYHRDHKWLKQPSFFLHGNFIPTWRYFEVFDLIRKLLLTSLVPYVGEVDSTTQCLFLLVVDTTSLVILAYSKPYQNSRDDFLSLVLVTTECAAFLMGVVVISGIDKDDNYHTSALYACLFVWFMVDLAIIMPLSLAAKSTTGTRFISSWSIAVVNRCKNVVACLGRPLRRTSGGEIEPSFVCTDNPLQIGDKT